MKTPNITQKITDIIQKETAYFNGWGVSESQQRESCETAAKKIQKYLNRLNNQNTNVLQNLKNL
jgi:hypothetical protein